MEQRWRSHVAWLLTALMLAYEGLALVPPARARAQDANAADAAALEHSRKLSEKTAAIDAQLAMVTANRNAIRTRGPTAMMVGGFVGFGVLGLLTAYSLEMGEPVRRGFGGATAGALVLGFGGLAWLITRKQQRRPYNLRIRYLRNQRKALLVAPQVAPTSLGLRLGARF